MKIKLNKLSYNIFDDKFNFLDNINFYQRLHKIQLNGEQTDAVLASINKGVSIMPAQIPVFSLPSNNTLPFFGFIKSKIILKNVVLPEPFAPNTAITLPDSAAKLIPFKTILSLYEKLKLHTSNFIINITQLSYREIPALM